MITLFKGQYAFLSNFFSCSIVFENQVYPSVEHAFQAAKTLIPMLRKEIQCAESPTEAKKLGRALTSRPDWEDIKVQVMTDLIREKFSVHSDLQDKLIKTGSEYLEEGNYWHDNFWGSCVCSNCGNTRGENMLGKILMSYRSYLTGKHMWHTCGNERCIICDGGLSVCIVCGGAEGTLTTECCGKRITSEEEDAIYKAETLDYKDKKWYKPIKVVHCKKEPYDILIDRTSKWGNPFYMDAEGDREEVVMQYAKWIVNQPHLIEALPELKGKILGCWCSPKLCHGHVLKYLVDGTGPFKGYLEESNASI